MHKLLLRDKQWGYKSLEIDGEITIDAFSLYDCTTTRKKKAVDQIKLMLKVDWMLLWWV